MLRSTSEWPDIRDVDFARTKYGSELLVDAAWIREMPGFIHWDEPYRLSFYDVTLVTAGRGEYRLDDRVFPLRPGAVYFTAPGQVRRWVADGLDGICMFFPAEFIVEHFADPLFLHRLHGFHDPAGPRAVQLAPGEAREIQARIQDMRGEIRNLRGDSPDYIRAIVYEVLIRLNRQYAAQHGLRGDTQVAPLASRFLHLVDAHFREEHRVAGYARRLGVTPGHLSVLTRSHLGRTAGPLIRGRIALEARRQLRHSSRTVSRIAADLGFRDPSYFARFFRRETGRSPEEFRASSRPP